jgi:hypothetical protein
VYLPVREFKRTPLRLIIPFIVRKSPATPVATELRPPLTLLPTSV